MVYSYTIRESNETRSPPFKKRRTGHPDIHPRWEGCGAPRFTSLGPTMLLRPALPRRFEQVPAMPGFGFFEPCGLKPKGTHCEASSGSAGALGSVKQLVLM